MFSEYGASSALAGSLIPVNRGWTEPGAPEEAVTIYLADNGIHADLILPAKVGRLDWAPLVPKSDFAAPDPAKMSIFEQNYTARFGVTPRALSSIAFDAAAAARTAAGPTGINMSTLMNPSGFSGPNGVFVLQPDGHVRRALALFEIDPTGFHIRQPGV